MINKHTADSVIASVLMAVGLAQLWGGFTMERLEIRRIHPASIPGLLPMFLGATMFLLAVIVFVTSRKALKQADESGDHFGKQEIRSVLQVGVLCGIYALFLVGNIHFWLASALFVFAFIVSSEWQRVVEVASRWRFLALAAVIAITITGGISIMFERGFLVRLP